MSIDQLTDAECEITECVGRKVNEVIEAVEGLQGQADAHEAMLNALQRWIGRVEGLVTEEVGQAADPVEAPTVEDRLEAMQATWQIMSESYTDACAEAKRLRAERDAAQERLVPFPATETCQECGSALGIGFHIADDVWAKISPTGGEGGVLCPWCADKRLKALGYTDVPAVFFPAFDVLRDEPGEWERRAREAEERARELEGHLTLDSGSLAEYEESVVPALEARIKALEADAALGALVRRAVETHRTVEIARSQTGYHDVLLNDHIDVHGKRHAIHGGGRKLDDALHAALGEEATDAH